MIRVGTEMGLVLRLMLYRCDVGETPMVLLLKLLLLGFLALFGSGLDSFEIVTFVRWSFELVRLRPLMQMALPYSFILA